MALYTIFRIPLGRALRRTFSTTMCEGRRMGVWFLLFLLCGMVRQGAAQMGYGFIENKNQWTEPIDYILTVPGGKMALQPGAIRYYFFDYNKINAFHRHEPPATFDEKSHSVYDGAYIDARHVRVDFINHNPHSRPVAKGPSQTYFNYFLGADSTRWGSGAKAYEEVRYLDLYPGIDLALKRKGERVKYDLIVAPGADPRVIGMTYSGAASLTLSEQGLTVDADLVHILERQPVAYQWIDGTRKEAPVQYALTGNRLSFRFPEGYDPNYELIIDPLLVFSTYSGFTADNWAATATPGENGTLYSAGVTNIFEEGIFAATPGAFQMRYGGGRFDVGLFKYDSLGQQLLYASYLGGSFTDAPQSLLVNHADELLILGATSSPDFPVTQGAYDVVFAGGPPVSPVRMGYENGADLFVTKISSDGTRILSSAYLGGTDNDGTNMELAANYGDALRGDLAVDANDQIYISSVTSSDDFPARHSFDTTYRGGPSDAVVARFSSDLDSLHWAVFLGGDSTDAAYSIALNEAEGALFVVGGTTSDDFPVTSGAYNTRYAPATAAIGWIARLDTAATRLEAATFISSSAYSQAYLVDLDSDGDVYVYGQKAGNFPITPRIYSNPGSGQFLQKYSPYLDQLQWSTVFGSGSGYINISPTAFLVNGECGDIYMAGWGGSINVQLNTDRSFLRPFQRYVMQSSTFGMPTTPDAFVRRTGGADFYLIVLSEDAQDLLYATFMGGSGSTIHVDGGTSRFDKRGIVYHAVCAGCGGIRADFPTTEGAWSATNNSANCNNAAFKFDLSTLQARLRANNLERTRPGLSVACFPEKLLFQNLSVGGQTYRWDFGDGSVISKTSKESVVHQYGAPGNYRVTLTAINPQACIGEATDRTTIQVSVANGSASPDVTVCYGNPATLLASGGSAYSWREQDEQVAFSSQSQTIVNPEDTTSYVATITNAEGCANSDTVVVNVVPNTDVSFGIKMGTACNVLPRIEVYRTNPDQEEVVFDFGDGATSTETRTTHEYASPGFYRIRASARRFFCLYEAQKEVPVFEITTPNVITPTATSGFNDTFKVLYGDLPADARGANVSLSVYNRWGKTVFARFPYLNDWNAEKLEAGIYYYTVKLDNHEECKDWLHVIK